jgi:hypothetical protein
MRGDGAIILDILNLVGRFFKFGMETKQFPSLETGILIPSVLLGPSARETL